jgi:hypothetical protein
MRGLERSTAIVSKSYPNKMKEAVSGRQQTGTDKNRGINRTLRVIVGELHRALNAETSNIIKIGELLVEAKTQVQHGGWLPFLKKEFSMSERSAQRYMKAYESYRRRSSTMAAGRC